MQKPTPQIQILVYNFEHDEIDRLDFFDTIKEARQWVKECGLDVGYWDRKAERQGWAKDNVCTIQLWKNDDCVADWFPEF